METLIKAASDFLAALVSTLGFIGRPRRRAGIRDDLDLLEQLRDSPEFVPDSAAHRFLTNHITVEVAKLSSIEPKRKKKIEWSSVLLALIMGIPLGYWTFKLDQESFRWVSLLPGTFAILMLLAIFGLLFGGDEAPDDKRASQTENPREWVTQ